MTAASLQPAASRVRTALSAPVRLSLGPTFLRLPRWRLAKMLVLPQDGSRRIALGGAAADDYFGRLSKLVDREPRDAQFAVYPGGIRIVPSEDGRRLDVAATARAVLAAAVSRRSRVAPVAIGTWQPDRTTKEAQAMGITGVVGSYQTLYGGIANRIHNVQLVAHLIDDHLIAPGSTFSFNGTTGERSADKGFLEAPVIINGELQTGLGGGVYQVSPPSSTPPTRRACGLPPGRTTRSTSATTRSAVTRPSTIRTPT